MDDISQENKKYYNCNSEFNKCVYECELRYLCRLMKLGYCVLMISESDYGGKS